LGSIIFLPHSVLSKFISIPCAKYVSFILMSSKVTTNYSIISRFKNLN
jgi:hypothetical protein